MSKRTNYRKLPLLTVVLLFYTTQVFPQLPEVAWEKQFTDVPSHYFSDITELQGGNFVILGAVQMPVDREFDTWLLKCNEKGDTLETKIFSNPGTDIPLKAGKCETSFTGTIGPWLLHVDKNGKLMSEQVYKFKFTKDQANRIICTSDGGFLLVGPGYIETKHQLSGWVKKLKPVL